MLDENMKKLLKEILLDKLKVRQGMEEEIAYISSLLAANQPSLAGLTDTPSVTEHPDFDPDKDPEIEKTPPKVDREEVITWIMEKISQKEISRDWVRTYIRKHFKKTRIRTLTSQEIAGLKNVAERKIEEDL